jgi:formate dehydrogenase major subunit/formate dehydrogenase alpha subunit
VREERRASVPERLHGAGGLRPGVAREVARETGIPEAEIHGVGSFFHLLARPHARVRVCTGLACRMAGADALLEAAEGAGLAAEGCSCLAACDAAPAVLRDRSVLPAVDPMDVRRSGGDWVELRSRDALDGGAWTGHVGPEGGAPESHVFDLDGEPDLSGRARRRARELGPDGVIALLEASGLHVIGSNTSEAHPVIAMEMKRAVARGATLVVADPRAIWMTSIAEKHLQLALGTDVWLLNAMAHVIVEEGLVDREFIEGQTENFAAVERVVAHYTPEEAEQVTGVPAEDIGWTARRYATTAKAGIYYTLGVTEHSHGTDNVYALANLVLMTGHLGKAASGVNPLRGQNNVQGANDAGASPIYLPGYQRVDDPDVRAKYEKAWGCALSPTPGLNLNEMMKRAGAEIRGFFVMGEDIVLSEPNVQRLAQALNGLEFLVLQEPFPNETARFADVILPSAVFAEKDGVFTNTERRVQLVRKAVEPPGQARADWQILVALANACGASWAHASSAEIYAELAAHAPRFAGISHERIERETPGGMTGIQWPYPDSEHPGTRFLHEGGVLRGKGLFQPVEYRPPAELADASYALLLSTGRTLYHYNAATQTRRESGLVAKQSEAFVEIHPRDAARRDIEDGDFVEVSTRRGAVELRAVVSRQVRPGSLWMPLHFAEARANVLTNDVGDAVTGTAEYKVCAAEVRRLGRAPRDAGLFPGSYYREGGPGPGG